MSDSSSSKFNLPKLWLKAYGIVSLWYLVNVFISSFTTYYLFYPFESEFLHGTIVFLFYLIYIAIAWAWSCFLFDKRVTLQVFGQFVGLILAFVAVSYLFFQLSIYFDNRTADDFWTYLIESHSGTNTSGRMDAFRIYNEYGAIIFIAYAIRYSQNLRKREQEKAQLQVQNKDMELNLLKSQINPHFLFNTLNSISTLVGSSKEKARRMITRLSSVIRYTLETGEEKTVPLRSEIQFINDYLSIQQVRFENHFEVIKEIDEACLDMSIPPMILQTLVENSIKYGVGQRDEGGKIWIRAKKRGDKFFIEVEDNGLGIHANKVMDKPSSTGIGLKNTNQRLQNIYGKVSKINVDARQDGFSVSFLIPSVQK